MAQEGVGSGGGTYRGATATKKPSASNLKNTTGYANPSNKPAPYQTRDTYTVTPSSSSISPYTLGAPMASGAVTPASSGASDEDYLQGDSQYQLQLAALMKALSDEQADTTAQQTKYNTDYGDAVKQLGWMQDDPTTPDVNEGAWNFQDATTAAGRAFQNQQNDFAGRGLLQSSAYAQKNDDLTRSLNDQLSSTNRAKQSFLDDLARQQGTFASDNQNQIQQARIEALARKASGVSLA